MVAVCTTIGFPRIGRQREMKVALERYWNGDSTQEDLVRVSHSVEHAAWKLQAGAGVSLVGLDGTMYDQMLDWVYYLGLAPARFAGLDGLQLYFAMARGRDGIPALDMTKFFDTNYHYMVPELSTDFQPRSHFEPFLDKIARGQTTIGKNAAVPIVIGPVTFAALASCQLSTSQVVERLLPVYCQLLQKLLEMQVPEVQLHEPFLATSQAASLRSTYQAAYNKLAAAGPALHLVTYYDDLADNVFPWAVQLPCAALTLDFLGVPGAVQGNRSLTLVGKHGWPAGKALGAGVVDGRSIWADNGAATAILEELKAFGVADVRITTSAPLQHLPYDIDLEADLPAAVKGRLGFATQKLAELAELARCYESLAPAVGGLERMQVVDPSLHMDRGLFERSAMYEERRPLQGTNRPFPTTTIGSFPQTAEIRRARLQYKRGLLNEAEYTGLMHANIAYAIGVQEALDLDVLVHGEAERTDMVEYFGTKLQGLAFTQHGWVQSYGSRYVRPPIIHGDVAFLRPMTVDEFSFAQSLTKRPVKGMLSGPITILNWSFPRKDITRRAQAFQLALALREEVAALQAAGCRVVQVDEPALREGLPLKADRWDGYLQWAVDAFRLCCAVAEPSTQVVTHLCYSDFQDIMPAIDAMDADVLTIENSRSGDEMLRALAAYGYNRDVGPGVYDVHSPVVPPLAFLETKITSIMQAGLLPGHPERVWVNPDCGLKTRGWPEVMAALRNMSAAASVCRQALAAGTVANVGAAGIPGASQAMPANSPDQEGEDSGCGCCRMAGIGAE